MKKKDFEELKAGLLEVKDIAENGGKEPTIRKARMPGAESAADRIGAALAIHKLIREKIKSGISKEEAETLWDAIEILLSAVLLKKSIEEEENE